MAQEEALGPDANKALSRRVLLGTVAAGAGTLALGAAAQAQTGPATPPSVITTPPRDFGPNGAPGNYFMDPDVLTVDPSFGGFAATAGLHRIWTGGGWHEGPAWNSQGRFFIWSDIPNNRQMRWLEEDGHVSVFRSPSNYSNGNTFDFQGRQISCEHLTRRVTRYEHDGSATIIADNYQGKHFNSPNDVVVHPDGGIWFTDPPYGGQMYEGEPDLPGGPTNAAGHMNPRIGQPAGFMPLKREMATGCYRADPSGRVDLVIPEEQLPDPNGILFSPDYKRLYVISTGKGFGDTGPGGKNVIYSFDLGSDNKPTNMQLFTECMVDGIKCGPDGMRCDVDGNVWVSSNAGRAIGYSGVTIWSPEGKLQGRVRTPEVVGNLCFGGPKRNRLFMAASQSIYALYVNTQGAGPG